MLFNSTGKIAIVSLAMAAYSVNAAERSRSAVISVNVRPEVSLQRQGDAGFLLRIRLAPQAHARLWRDSQRGSPAPNAHVVSESGTFSIAMSTIPGSGNMVCLASSDAILRATIPVAPVPAP